MLQQAAVKLVSALASQLPSLDTEAESTKSGGAAAGALSGPGSASGRASTAGEAAHVNE
jgi:hypothetical protein